MKYVLKRWVMLILVLLPVCAEAQVYRDRVQPHWMADNDQFWYRVELADGAKEFIHVDAVAGLRELAFDHERLAQVLSGLTGESISPDKLPFESLSYGDDGTIGLTGGEVSWRLNPADYSVVEVNDLEAGSLGLPFDRRPRPSMRTGESTTLILVNRLDRPVKIHWMDTSGNQTEYGTLEPGQRRKQHTYGGHVWTVTETDGEILAVFEAEDQVALAVIDGREPDRRGPHGRRHGPPPGGPRGPQAENAPSPDGQWAAYVRDHNLWLRNAETSEQILLSKDGSEVDTYHKDVYLDQAVNMNYTMPEAPATMPNVTWSPDSKYLIALKTPQVEHHTVYMVNSSPTDQLQPRLESYPYLKPGDDLPIGVPHLFNAETGQEIPLDHPEWFASPWSIDSYQWLPDSSRFVFLFNQRGHQCMRVLSVDAATGHMIKLVDEVCETFFDYSSKSYLNIMPESQELIWMSERSGWNHLYLVDLDSGAVKNPITQGDWVVRSVERVDEESRQIWFRALGVVPGQDPYWVHYGRVNFDGTGLTFLTAGPGNHAIEWSPDQRFLLDTYSTVNHPPKIVLRDANGREVCPLEEADASELLATGRQFAEPFVAKGRDGVTDIYGIIHRPLDFDPAKSYPVIEAIYAGPHGAFTPKGFRESYGSDALTDLGFIVVEIDGMGTNWRSRAFHDVCWKNIVDAGFPDRILWMKAAAQKYPTMDLTRVGIYGGSAGGQNALGALLTHGEFYKVAVADCGCHDNRMDKAWWNEQWMGYPIGPHYEAQSNVTLAANLQGDLLLVGGELDRNVDPATTMQVADALIRADKDFDMLIVPGSGHCATSMPYGQRRLRDYFVEHLQP